LGFAYDGFPVYGAYSYANTDGTGAITRMKSGYQLRNITVRTHHADGTDVGDGPAVSATYPLGTYREDYEWVANADASYLDEHNGRFCITPEYPAGIYCYFATVDANHNSTYPYIIGPTYYGNKTGVTVTSVTETTTVYNAVVAVAQSNLNANAIKVFPNPAADLIAIQVEGLNTADITVELIDVQGKLIQSAFINKGQTLTYFDVQTLYSGVYFVRLTSGDFSESRKIVIAK
jgi:hypothetical protein